MPSRSCINLLKPLNLKVIVEIILTRLGLIFLSLLLLLDLYHYLILVFNLGKTVLSLLILFLVSFHRETVKGFKLRHNLHYKVHIFFII